MRIQNLSNMRFGRLVCIKPVGRYEKNRSIIWQCKCDCGNVVEVVRGSLVSGKTRSCGCLQKEKATEACKSRTIHGFGAQKLTGSGLYKSWAHMKERCLNSNNQNYKYYGGRGIKVCKKWLTFNGFREDMERSYKRGLCIERIDNNGDYEPSNCRWANRVEQNNNKRNNRLITCHGETMTVAQWARKTGIAYKTIINRIYCGWDPRLAVTALPRFIKPGPKPKAKARSVKTA